MSRPGRKPWGFLMVAAACVACGEEAFRRSSDVLASACTSLLVIALILAVLHARFGSASTRRFFWGFALAGWAYTIVAYGPLGTQMRGGLVTGLIIERMLPPIPTSAQEAQVQMVWRAQAHLVGHILFALAAGLLGGLFAERIAEREARESRRPEPGASGEAAG